MKKILIDYDDEATVRLENVGRGVPIFAFDKDGNLGGMVVNEQDKGWILRLGGSSGSTGWSDDRTTCLRKAAAHGWIFRVGVKLVDLQ